MHLIFYQYLTFSLKSIVHHHSNQHNHHDNAESSEYAVAHADIRHGDQWLSSVADDATHDNEDVSVDRRGFLRRELRRAAKTTVKTADARVNRYASRWIRPPYALGE